MRLTKRIRLIMVEAARNWTVGDNPYATHDSQGHP